MEEEVTSLEASVGCRLACRSRVAPLEVRRLQKRQYRDLVVVFAIIAVFAVIVIIAVVVVVVVVVMFVPAILLLLMINERSTVRDLEGDSGG